MKTPLDMLSDRMEDDQAVKGRPERSSFEEFLCLDARVPLGGGHYGPYTFLGREAILEIVRVIDQIRINRLTDSTVALAGGAQFGKTILELNFMAYATSQLFFNVGLYLPDIELVQGVVDTKLRPDVIDQIPWFADMVSVGRAVNKSGKAVNRKGAFTVTDGKRTATGMIMGLGRVPTSFTFDVTSQDEKDDIPEKNAKFVEGRRTSSQFRFSLEIGTQRVHGRGMNASWKNGSQGVVEIGGHNPEEKFPGIIRCAITGTPLPTDPKLTWAGDFRHDDAPTLPVANHDPGHLYYLADPDTGAPLNRYAPVWIHRQPQELAKRNWSFRISQLSIAAIGLSQIVGQFERAVADPDRMIVFRCDVLALPQSTSQALGPDIIQRAQKVEPFEMGMTVQPDMTRYGGVDVGDKCWFIARERENDWRKRLIYATSIPLGDLVERTVGLFHQLKLSCLFIDQRPDADPARDIALALNGLNALEIWPKVPDSKDAHLSLGGLIWDGPAQQWRGLKAAVVRFDKKTIGSGIEHSFDIFEQGGQTKFVPLIKCNRQDSIDRVVREFLTPDEGVCEYFGKPPIMRVTPSMLLPVRGYNKIVETVEAHFITGSERERLKDGTKGDYVDGCDNHFLLADAYSALAEGENIGGRSAPFAYERVDVTRRSTKDSRFNRRSLS